MKVIVKGNSETVHRLATSFVGKDQELICPPKVHDVITLIEIGKYDLVIVDSLTEEVATICNHTRGLEGIQVVLMVEQKQPDWAKIQSLGINGLIPWEASGVELVARLEAIVRRCSIGREIYTLEPKQSVEQMAKTALMPNVNKTSTRTLCDVNTTVG
jgi:DNA-binding response OmpR family regulator